MELKGKVVKDVFEDDFYCRILFTDGTDYLIETSSSLDKEETVLEYTRDKECMHKPKTIPVLGTYETFTVCKECGEEL